MSTATKQRTRKRRRQHPVSTKLNPWNVTPPLPPHPTMAWPMSEEKLDVMRERVEQGYHLHHPDDFKPDDIDDVPINQFFNRRGQP